MIDLLLSATTVNNINNEIHEVESCIGEDFALLESADPKWPIHSKWPEGFVDLIVEVDKDGYVTGHEVIYAEPKRVFDRASIKAIKKWKFNSSKYDERCFEIRFKFTLANEVQPN